MRAVRAFTLVEVLIVVVILGVLSAIVVPQFTNATQDAQGGNVVSQLDTLNNQAELFKARSGNSQYPDFADPNVWQTLISGGYIKAAPVNPVNQSSTVNTTGNPDGAGWWWYQDASGNFSLEACEFDNRPTGATAHRPLPGQQAIPSH